MMRINEGLHVVPDGVGRKTECEEVLNVESYLEELRRTSPTRFAGLKNSNMTAFLDRVITEGRVSLEKVLTMVKDLQNG